MKKNYKKTKKGSAIVYALIIAATAGFLILVASAVILLTTITSSQATDGIQAYYSSESAMEFGYTARRYLAGIFYNEVKIFPFPDTTGGEASKTVSRSELDITTKFTDTPEARAIIFRTIDNNSTDRASRDLTTMTMDFKIYLNPVKITPDPAPPDSWNNYILMTDGYYGSAQYNLKSFVGNPGDLFLPYIATAIP